jgi:hypothetical protein
LRSWNAQERNIILVGASAGHNLPDDFLRKFESVTVYDPDLSAPFFFKKNHPHVKLKWSHEDVLGVSRGLVNDLRETFSAHPDSAILFCNVIGQLPLLLQNIPSPKKTAANFDNVEIENFMKNLSEEIYTLSEILVNGKRRSVASFHDLYSRSLKSGQENILRDHMTQKMFSDELWQKENLKWSLTANEEHQIECVFRQK